MAYYPYFEVIEEKMIAGKLNLSFPDIQAVAGVHHGRGGYFVHLAEFVEA